MERTVVDNTPRPKFKWTRHRAGKRRKKKKHRSAAYLANVARIKAGDEAVAAILAKEPQPEPRPEGSGGNPETVAPQETALFERPREIRTDANMTQRAIKKRWETPKPLSEVVIQKVLTLAAGAPWQGPPNADGSPSRPRQEEWTPGQLAAAAKLALDVERQNQGEEHHGDRMGYAERALQMRAKVGDYRPANSGVAAMVETEGAARVSIYLPARDDDDEIPVLLDADRVDGAP